MRATLRFAAVLSSIITLCALVTHLLEMPAKMQLDKQQYQVVQGIYRGWELLGIFEIAAIVFTGMWWFNKRKTGARAGRIGAAFFLFLISLAVFFLFTYPANLETDNWTALPQNWEEMRNKWEYSHAARALLNLAGLCLLLHHLIHRRDNRRSPVTEG